MSDEIDVKESVSKDLPEPAKNKLRIFGAGILIIASVAVFVAKEWPKKEQSITPINNSQKQIIHIKDSGKPGSIKPVQQNNTNAPNNYTDNSTNAPVTKITNNTYIIPKKPNPKPREINAGDKKRLDSIISKEGYKTVITISISDSECNTYGLELYRYLQKGTKNLELSGYMSIVGQKQNNRFDTDIKEDQKECSITVYPQ